MDLEEKKILKWGIRDYLQQSPSFYKLSQQFKVKGPTPSRQRHELKQRGHLTASPLSFSPHQIISPD
jgi:hypothetical protein